MAIELETARFGANAYCLCRSTFPRLRAVVLHIFSPTSSLSSYVHFLGFMVKCLRFLT